ncbi:MAG: beta-hydroxyacyl-ACP dehydratase [Deltaproteobacteria bacterium]|nr:beta-hydroxyacyl-ACP dehydratase [Deltaproteobacteria bacterium]
MRYYLIDRITGVIPKKSAVAVKNISFSDDVFNDHFPEIPVYPGCMLTEAMAQLGGFLVEISNNHTGEQVKRAMLVQIDRAKFYLPVEPGDQIIMTATLDSTLADAAQIACECHVAAKKVATARLHFVLKSVEAPLLHEKRREVYKIWTKGLDLNFPLI